MRHGPSIPIPIPSMIDGTPARDISWPMITCSIGPRPWPPNSFGQVAPARPASASLPCHARRALTYSSSSSNRSAEEPPPCAAPASSAPSPGIRPARECRSDPLSLPRSSSSSVASTALPAGGESRFTIIYRRRHAVEYRRRRAVESRRRHAVESPIFSASNTLDLGYRPHPHGQVTRRAGRGHQATEPQGPATELGREFHTLGGRVSA